MKQLFLLAAILTPSLLSAEAVRPADRPFFKKQAPPIIYHGDAPVAATTQPAAAQPAQTYVYDQKPVGGGGVPPLVSREQADGVVNQFKDTYAKLKSPRVLVYVNRDLVDTTTGLRLSSRNEKVETTRSSVKSTVESNAQSANVSINASGSVNVNGNDNPGKGQVSRTTDNIHSENRYSHTERKQTLADKQTVRDVERLFGRPLRAAGATLTDQSVATQLIANRPLKEMMANTEGDQAQKDREALKKIADVAIEVLISSRSITNSTISGDKTYTVPDIQATAIRLSDSQILGQASSRDVTGAHGAQNYDVQEIAEATALALMEDMGLSAK